MNSLTKAIAISTITLLPLTACEAGRENEATGAVLGAAVGALAGSQIGDGSGRSVAMAVGAMTGMLIGAQIGQRLDEHSLMKARQTEHQALSSAPVGQAITWSNPDNQDGSAKGTYIIRRDGQDQDGRTCREYSHEITIAGETETVIGQACLGDDGRWTQI